MKALIISGPGDVSALKLGTTTIPDLQPHQVLVKVKAAGINPIDWQTPEYGFLGMLGITPPYTMGNEVAGVIERVGKNVPAFNVGEEVMGALATQRPGSFAEYVVVDEDKLVLKPKGLSFVEAAAVSLTGLTAVQALFDHLKLGVGQKVLIQAAAGGVGVFAVQLAKQAGAHVVAVGSGKNAEFLTSLGADEVFDYKFDFKTLPADLDAVLDSMNSPEKTMPLLKKGGRYVSIAQPPAPELARQLGVTASSFLYNPNSEQLKEVVGLIGRGQLKIFIDKTFPLEQVVAGLQYQKAGHTRGKNVIIVE